MAHTLDSLVSRFVATYAKDGDALLRRGKVTFDSPESSLQALADAVSLARAAAGNPDATPAEQAWHADRAPFRVSRGALSHLRNAYISMLDAGVTPSADAMVAGYGAVQRGGTAEARREVVAAVAVLPKVEREGAYISGMVAAKNAALQAGRVKSGKVIAGDPAPLVAAVAPKVDTPANAAVTAYGVEAMQAAAEQWLTALQRGDVALTAADAARLTDTLDAVVALLVPTVGAGVNPADVAALATA